jgi:adenine phosphoribosyltransferase
VLRKSVKGYLKHPLTVKVKSITTAAAQSLVLDGNEADRLRGSRVVVVDDVVSTGGSLRACEELLDQVGAQVVARAAVLLEEGGYENPNLISLGTLPIFTK